MSIWGVTIRSQKTMGIRPGRSKRYDGTSAKTTRSIWTVTRNSDRKAIPVRAHDHNTDDDGNKTREERGKDVKITL